MTKIRKIKILKQNLSEIEVKSAVIYAIKHKNVKQIYKGNFVRGLCHGYGLMIWQEIDILQIYEGYFYANLIHGYGRMIYPDGLIFEGLYKNNKRFGPGVMTHTNQNQDVGFWFSHRLLRLISDFTSNIVPSFNLTKNISYLKLLKFKNLIDLSQEPYAIINSWKCNEMNFTINNSLLYSKDYQSLFFDINFFNDNFSKNFSTFLKEDEKFTEKNKYKLCEHFDDLIQKYFLITPKDELLQSTESYLGKCSFRFGEYVEFLSASSWSLIVNENSEAFITGEEVSKKTHIDKWHSNICPYMLAYNNNTFDKMILTHSFQQKFAESHLLFNVNDLWEGKRSAFAPPSHQELASIRLLTELDLSPDDLRTHIVKSNIEVDVADGLGNTRFMIAVAKDQHEIMHCLIELGAYIECCNDDGFTPLNLSLMRYVCLLNDIKTWNEYVIPHIDFKFQIPEGSKHCFLRNIRKINFFSPENLVNLNFLGDTSVSILEKSNWKINHSVVVKLTVLELIEKTILILISKGAQTNSCFIPKTTIHMALLTCNPKILEAVILSQGDIHYTLSENPIYEILKYDLPWKTYAKLNTNMTALDIVCLMKRKLTPDISKNSLVYQMEKDLAVMLYDVTDKNHSFCGLNAVALAMLTGKKEIVKALLFRDNKLVNKVFKGLGNLLFLLFNPQYNMNLSPTLQNDFLNLLLYFNANPLFVVNLKEQQFHGNIYDYHCFLENRTLSRTLLNQEFSTVTNVHKKITDKLKSSGRLLLNKLYTNKAIIVLLNSYNLHRGRNLSSYYTAMILWIDSGFEFILHQISTHHIYYDKPLKTENTFAQDNSIVYQQYIRTLFKEVIKNNKTLRKDESNVCYECLKHTVKNMKKCSVCYFALLCTNECEKEHEFSKCLVKIRKNLIIKIQNQFPINNELRKQAIQQIIHQNRLNSTLFSISKQISVKCYDKLQNRKYQMILPSTLSSPISAVEVLSLVDVNSLTNLSEMTSNLSDEYYSQSKNFSNIQSKSSIKYNDYEQKERIEQSTISEQTDNLTIEQHKTLHARVLEFLEQWKTNYKKHYWSMRQMREKTLELSDVSVLKFKTKRMSGCKRPMLMFLDNFLDINSSGRQEIPDTKLSYLAMTKENIIENNLENKCLNFIHNYSQL
ncbi:uncharacterized protein LOC126902801 [Daktulosphaira vitifoliae]|uniref:uncharacterized protein LOC126902801 n=1 Tax=Daktulosphaira vitifoliae TaxID=58002 RepID=UPI0021AA56C9|nr:uncharacterized protein LOC126902801 [Daktulosphaira vitifoliae]